MAHEALGISEEEYATVMAAHTNWPYPASEDAICKTHEALRADLTDLAAAVEAMERSEEDGQPRASKIWMLVNLKKWMHAFSHNYTHTFEAQDKFFFKLLKTKVTDEAKLHSAEEVSTPKLLAHLRAVEAQVNALSTQKPYHMAAMREKLAALDAAVRAHMAAIEAVPLAHLRKEFTREETKWALEKHVVEEGKAQDAGWLLARAFATDAARDAWMHAVPEISSMRRKEVDIPAAHAYLKNTHILLADIVTGKHIGPHASAGDAGGCCNVQ